MKRRQLLENPVPRRDLLELIGKTSLVALFAAACRRTPLPPVIDPKRPNIVYIHSHDTGRYIEPYGHHISTPNLQRFADEGMVFRQMFTASPTYSPSRASLMTGMTPGSSGMWGLAHKGNKLNDYNQGLVPFFNRLNYKTVLAGVQHIYADSNPVGAARHVGYSAVLSPKGRLSRANVDAAIDYLNGPISGPSFSMSASPKRTLPINRTGPRAVPVFSTTAATPAAL